MRQFLYVLFMMVMIPYVTTLAWTGKLEQTGVYSEIKDAAELSGVFGDGSGLTMNAVVIVERDEKQVEMPVEEFLVPVLAAQIPADFGMEALKAQAILARTYIYRLLGDDGRIYEEELDMDARSTEQMKQLWGEDQYPVMRERLQTAAKETGGLYLLYEGELIEPLYCYASAGKTRSRGDLYPYLRQAESPGDLLAENYRTLPVFEIRDFVKKINEIPGAVAVSAEELADGGGLQIVERDSAGYVKTVQIGQKTYTGEEVQYALGLNSSCFSFERLNGKIRVICKGIGHGYGFSQFGANELEKEGLNYEELLQHYFQNVEIVGAE